MVFLPRCNDENAYDGHRKRDRRLRGRLLRQGDGRPDARPNVREAIPDLPDHLAVIRDFWSNALLGTGRYHGAAYQAHARLPIEVEHFDRWLSLFSEAARETLPSSYADRAIAKAKHMTQSFRVGMFPFTLPDGRPSRTPA